MRRKKGRWREEGGKEKEEEEGGRRSKYSTEKKSRIYSCKAGGLI